MTGPPHMRRNDRFLVSVCSPNSHDSDMLALLCCIKTMHIISLFYLLLDEQ